MSSALDMSLEDLIKNNKKSGGGGGGGSRGGRGGGGGGGRGSSGPGPNRRFNNRGANRTTPYSLGKPVQAPETLFTNQCESDLISMTTKKKHSFGKQDLLLIIVLVTILMADGVASIRLQQQSPLDGRRMIIFPDSKEQSTTSTNYQTPLKTAVFALGSFWRSEAVFGCLNGVVRTTVGYAGGSKINPEFRSLGDHAESVQIEYNPRMIHFRQLLDVFWSSHDSRQVFGQGPDVGNQYRSIIFTNGTEEVRLAAARKEREQTKSRNSIVTTQIQQLGTFYPAEPEHQKFELKRNPFLLQLIGNMPEEELTSSSLAAKLDGYAAELCPPKIQKQIDAKINDILRKGWPILREV
ncbi:hypothetical protein AQUCO_21900001v1 [Aquilegia coerulea]|uniref:Peptide methionine sulfoxide reductase A5 n=2 Tax=Aquilegia coerulea TaxID=218851 RepID=A0A2G5C0M0_AQUCA|nr:hypothetical protein AQUCO_21900001v1 [Aquilegia coerulea]